MNNDLIFHVVSNRKWHNLNKQGNYQPDEEEGSYIECVRAESLNTYLNDKFSGRKNLLILVIDKNRIIPKTEKAKDFILINGPLNTDAILDKIQINCNENKGFDLKVETL